MSMAIKSNSAQSHIRFSAQTPAMTCDQCGYPTARVAHLVDADGGEVGSAVVCTRCQPGRHRTPAQPAD